MKKEEWLWRVRVRWVPLMGWGVEEREKGSEEEVMGSVMEWIVRARVSREKGPV